MGLNQRVSPGDRIKIEARDWNDILAAAAKAREHSTTPAPQIEPTDYACTVVCVRNDSGARLGRFAAVGLGAPIKTPTDNLPEFKRRPTFKVVTPIAGTHENNFGITVEPIAKGKLGYAVVAGVVPVQLTVAGGAALLGSYAEIANGVTTLANAATGSARVLWAEASGGTRWALVRIGSGTSTLKYARWVRFHLANMLAASDASQANCPVDYSWDGPSPGATITVWNQPKFNVAGQYLFANAANITGLASYDPAAGKYWIVQLDC